MIISIQSQVLHGHVGNSAAAFPIQHLGIPVTAVPTTLLSNHPHYPTMRGRVLEPDLLRDLLMGVEERGLVDGCLFLMTGYLGSAANGEVVADFVTRAKRRNPALRYCCDPVMGDSDLGFFTDATLRDVFRDRLTPMADISTPNAFEFAHLGDPPGNDRDAGSLIRSALCQSYDKTIVITGMGLADPDAARIDTVAAFGGRLWKVSTPRLPCRPAGTGDLLTALLVARLAQNMTLPQALETAVSSVFAVLLNTASVNATELALIESRAELESRKPRFRALEIQAGRETYRSGRSPRSLKTSQCSANSVGGIGGRIKN